MVSLIGRATEISNGRFEIGDEGKGQKGKTIAANAQRTRSVYLLLVAFRVNLTRKSTAGLGWATKS
jgi:hypothetical protein